MKRTREGRVVWITGAPATGKSTLAQAILLWLQEQGAATLWLDSDSLRQVLTPRPTYDDNERDFFYGVLGHLAVLGAQGGVEVIVSATAPKRSYRNGVRSRVPRFIEIYLHCDETTLRHRDIKGLYAASDAGQISCLPGQGSTYEVPLRPELTLDTATCSPQDALAAAKQCLCEPVNGVGITSGS